MEAELISALTKKSAYNHAVSEPIKTKTTHISIVFLTGKYAYKIKKSVSYDFLDFTSLEKRHHFCMQELRLNRRFAPEIYLDVIPIIKNAKGEILVGKQNESEEAIEWAIKMLEFKQEQLLLNLSKNNKLDRNITCMLARSIADFHLKSEPIASSSPYGSFESIKHVVLENFAETESGIGFYFSREDFLAIKTYQENYLKNNGSQFLERKEAGKIKSCHGDLHLGNICYFDKKVKLFDCIEFSEDFRNIDVLYDIAFTIMDFEFRGFSDLANLLLNQYLEWTADYEGLGLLSFYCSVRAYIRAKVSYLAVKSQAPEKNPDTQEQISKYIDLAKSYSTAGSGLILVVCGVSGSGKSTIARELAMNLNAVHLRSDVIRKHLGKVGMLNKADASLYSEEMNKKTYKRLEQLAFKLQDNRNVIVDAKFDFHHLREPYFKWKNNGTRVLFIHCTASKEELKFRLDHRKGDVSDADASLIESQKKQWQSFKVEEAGYVLNLDTQRNLPDQIKVCLDFIGKHQKTTQVKV